jgi:CheY-like chemotaxis protein
VDTIHRRVNNQYVELVSNKGSIPKLIYITDPLRFNNIDFSRLPKGVNISQPLIISKLYEGFLAVSDQTDYQSEQHSPISLTLPEHLRGMTALLVEDNAINQEVGTSLLKKLGFEVDLAKDGIEAAEKFNPDQHQVVFMDLQMPRMDGFEATQKIRETPRGQQTPIIAMTAAAFDQDRERIINAGMEGHIKKPLDIHIIRTQLIEILNKHQLNQKTSTDAQDPIVGRLNHSQQDCLVNNAGALSETSPEALPETAIAVLLESAEGFDMTEALQRVLNDSQLLFKSLELFESSASDWREQLLLAIDQQQLDNIKKLAHTLSGSASGVGAKELHQVAKAVEKSLNEENSKENICKCNALIQHFDAATEVIKDKLKGIREALALIPQQNTPKITISFEDCIACIEDKLNKHVHISDADLDKLTAATLDMDIDSDQELSDLKTCITQYDYDQALAIIKAIQCKYIGKASSWKQKRA